jgi:NTE family protein
MNYNFKNLVFEGGGVKGIAYGGALKVLDELDILPGIIRVGGTSAGAINAALLALGFSFQEVSDIIASTNFNDFEDKSKVIFGNMRRILKYYGWFKGDAFTGWIGEKIKKKTGKVNFTFGELKEAVTGNEPGFRELYLAVTNLTQQKVEIYSHESSPDVAIKDAVRMSMSIPLFFKAVKRGNDILVDGGLAYNYPIDLFDREKYLVNPANRGDYTADAKGYVYNFETLGFRLDSKEIIRASKDDWSLVPVKIKNLKDHIVGVLNFLMDYANKVHLRTPDWNRTIFIDTLDVKTTEFDVPQEKIEALLESGRVNTEKYFAWRDTDPVWGKYPK